MKLKSNIATSDSGYIFDPSSGESYTVNPIGIQLINLIKNKTPYEAILKEILDKYNIDKDTFEKDYQDFVGLLKQHQLIDNNNGK